MEPGGQVVGMEREALALEAAREAAAALEPALELEAAPALELEVRALEPGALVRALEPGALEAALALEPQRRLAAARSSVMGGETKTL